MISAPATLYVDCLANSLPFTAHISVATSCTCTRCTNGKPSPGTRIGRPSSRRRKNAGSRVTSGDFGPIVCVTRSVVHGRSVVASRSSQPTLFTP